jgi:hypothetical protein
MTILGIGGVVSWGFVKQSTSSLANKVVEIFGYSIKTGVALLLLAPASWLWAVIYEHAFRAFSGGSFSYVKYYWDSDDPLPYLLPHIIGFLIVVPIYLTVASVVFYSSLDPLTKMLRSIFRPGRD